MNLCRKRFMVPFLFQSANNKTLDELDKYSLNFTDIFHLIV
ncbi:hypothetical protein MHC_06021 [Mycoplasma haemocanis str. Illinois]|uniref:Uncharacterized protein n=1 Tax=Mycoplasma haemocanis (strain Illinois) TaxID=1111676 RepID=I6R7N5_MYCHN|nr:hypothetical protein MHC_06021 [Mycoplasma haemocanis str. Illinois]